MILSIILLFIVTILVALVTCIVTITYLLNAFQKHIDELDEINSELINELIKENNL